MTLTRCLTAGALLIASVPAFADTDMLTYGLRPAFLIDKMEDGALKDKLASCLGQTPAVTTFSIGHRGAAMQFPEHTAQSYRAAARMGAGIIECDVTFTADHELVCRHAQNDLATTTTIVASDLADSCVTPFTAASGDEKATAECRTAELTLEQFKSLSPKMDAANRAATTAEEFVGGTPAWRTELYVPDAQVVTHAESIALIRDLGAKFTPELKSPSVEMPHDGWSQEDYAQAMIDEYKEAGIPASDVWAQSFNLDDVLYWINAEPEFGAQAVYLVEWSDGFDEQNAETWAEDFAALKEQGVNYLAPSLNMLVTADGDGYAASEYAKAAKEAGLTLIAWTLERSGPLASGGGWYFQSVTDVTNNDADYFEVLDTLAQDVGVVGVFSDWPATVTYYANCMGL